MNDPGPGAKPLPPIEAARRLGVDPKTLNRWAERGVIPRSAWFRLPTGGHRYHPAAIAAIVANRQDGGRP